MRKKYRRRRILIVLIAVVLILLVAGVLTYHSLFPRGRQTADDFGIATIHSGVDFNNNGLDDYTDILQGARQDAQKHVTYNASYFEGGYPPDGKGVCADEIWRAFKNAGYDLKDMVDKDIAAHPDAYLPAGMKPDPNIDFRRTPNLNVFFSRYATTLTCDLSDHAQWQPGDIAVLGHSHIGIISDIRDKNGVPYLIHNNNQPGDREEDILPLYAITGRINEHYRWDASRIDKSVLVPWYS